MRYTIKNRYTDVIIVEMEAKTLKEVVVANKANLQEADLRKANLQEADLRKANLWGANLQWADLQGADLQWANLQWANLWGAKIKITQKEELLKSLGIEIVE